MSGTVASDGYLDASQENGYYLNTNYHKGREVHDTAGAERRDTWTSKDAKCTREMYFDDAKSIAAKYDLVNRDNLRGAGLFALQYGAGAPELWDAIAAAFTHHYALGAVGDAAQASTVHSQYNRLLRRHNVPLRCPVVLTSPPARGGLPSLGVPAVAGDRYVDSGSRSWLSGAPVPVPNEGVVPERIGFTLVRSGRHHSGDHRHEPASIHGPLCPSSGWLSKPYSSPPIATWAYGLASHVPPIRYLAPTRRRSEPSSTAPVLISSVRAARVSHLRLVAVARRCARLRVSCPMAAAATCSMNMAGCGRSRSTPIRCRRQFTATSHGRQTWHAES